jgi:hypothetical protein
MIFLLAVAFIYFHQGGAIVSRVRYFTMENCLFKNNTASSALAATVTPAINNMGKDISSYATLRNVTFDANQGISPVGFLYFGCFEG